MCLCLVWNRLQVGSLSSSVASDGLKNCCLCDLCGKNTLYTFCCGSEGSQVSYWKFIYYKIAPSGSQENSEEQGYCPESWNMLNIGLPEARRSFEAAWPHSGVHIAAVSLASALRMSAMHAPPG